MTAETLPMKQTSLSMEIIRCQEETPNNLSMVCDILASKYIKSLLI